MRTRSHTIPLFTVAIVAAAGIGISSPVSAQEATTPAPAAEPAAHHRQASGGSTGLGVGAAAFVSGLTGPQVVYDFGLWHVEGLLGFDHRPVGANNSATTIDFGVSGWYHLHLGESSDFSVGGGLGFMSRSQAMGPSANATVLEPGAQIRAFVTPNVAVHARLALALVFGDDVNSQLIGGLAEHWGLAGQLVSGFGFTYFFR